MSYVNINLGLVEVDLDDLSDKVASNCQEPELLDALAKANEAIVRETSDGPGRRFAADAAVKLHELAKWFRKNQP